MKSWIGLACLLAAGCGGAGRRDAEPDETPKPKATIEQYRALAEAVLDGIASLDGRLRGMEGFRRPAAAMDVDFSHKTDGLTLRGRMSLGRLPEASALPIRLGSLGIQVVVEGPEADAVMEAIREVASAAWSSFWARYEP